MDIIENNLVTAIREIVRQEIKSQITENLDFITRSDLESFTEDYIAQHAYGLIESEIDEGIGHFIRNHVNIELNC